MVKKRFLLFMPLLSLFFAYANSTLVDNTSVPLITSIEWGKSTIQFNGKNVTFKDMKLWPNNAKTWNWQETGTQHVPGIQVADLEEFINDVEVVVLTYGKQCVLQVPQETIDYITKKGKTYYAGQTDEMVQKYNQLIQEGKKVGGLFHSTC